MRDGTHSLPNLLVEILVSFYTLYFWELVFHTKTYFYLLLHNSLLLCVLLCNIFLRTCVLQNQEIVNWNAYCVRPFQRLEATCVLLLLYLCVLLYNVLQLCFTQKLTFTYFYTTTYFYNMYVLLHIHEKKQRVWR